MPDEKTHKCYKNELEKMREREFATCDVNGGQVSLTSVQSTCVGPGVDGQGVVHFVHPLTRGILGIYLI